MAKWAGFGKVVQPESPLSCSKPYFDEGLKKKKRKATATVITLQSHTDIVLSSAGLPAASGC